MNLQPTLENEYVKAQPLKTCDFEKLYAVASDPLIWEQHPNKERYQRAAFKNFFKGAMQSGGAFLILDNKSREVIGSSRFYDFNKDKNQVLIGYTFFDRNHWGGIYNSSLKKLMITYAFQFVDDVVFHIGATNVRSQKSIERLGAVKINELEVEYFGEPSKLNFVYQIKRLNFTKN